MDVILPTMSIFGFTTDPNVITEKLFLYFVTSEYSQSVTFYGKISSLKYLLNQYATDPDKLKSEIYDTLVNLYKKYFPKVSVEVDVKENKKTKKNELIISITTETEDGVISTVNETLVTSGSKITNILDLVYR